MLQKRHNMTKKPDENRSSAKNIATGGAIGTAGGMLLNRDSIKNAATTDNKTHLKHLLSESERESDARKGASRKANDFIEKNKGSIKTNDEGKKLYSKAQEIVDTEMKKYKFKKYNKLSEVIARAKNVGREMKNPLIIGGLSALTIGANEASKGWK
jgi:hypothetical protein